MNNIIQRIWKQGMVGTEFLPGSLHQSESEGHTFEISGEDPSGAALTLAGDVSAIFLRADQQDVPLTGSVSNGVASVTLSDACYDVPGPFGLTIFLTSDNQTACIYSAVGSVSRDSTGVIASAGVTDIMDLIDRINAAINAIPADYSDLQSSVSTLQTRVTNQATAINTINANEIKEEMVTRMFTVDVDTATTTYIPLDLYCISGKEVVVTVSGVSISGENSMRLYHGEGYLDTETTIIRPSTVTTVTIDCVCSPAAIGGELHINFTGTGTATVTVQFYPGMNYVFAELMRFNELYGV